MWQVLEELMGQLLVGLWALIRITVRGWLLVFSAGLTYALPGFALGRLTGMPPGTGTDVIAFPLMSALMLGAAWLIDRNRSKDRRHRSLALRRQYETDPRP